MDANLITPVATLAGAAVGGTASFIGSLLAREGQVRAQSLGLDRRRRLELYREFIEVASKCYIHALQHHEPDVLALVVLYAKMSEMRVVSSPTVLAAAEKVLRRIADTYPQEDIAFTDEQLRSVLNHSFDLLREFAEECRAEFDQTRVRLS